MTRLAHPFKAQLRALEISRHQLFAFVEGKVTDPYFYDKVCHSVCQPRNVSYQLIRACELPHHVGGKQALLAFHDYLRTRSALIDSFKGKRTLCVFFLDKDIDDLLRHQRRSRHIIYTLYYDVENHLFAEGNLLEAAAACTSLDQQRLATALGTPTQWRRQVAENHKQWITLCIFVAKKRINHECN